MPHTANSRTPASEYNGSAACDPKRVADYLRRYPDISDQERTDLIGNFRQLSNLDIAFMLSDPDVAPRLERFRAEHKRDTRLPFRDYAMLLALGIVCLLSIVYAVLVET
jgi:hypothetical protein